jgi:hypothetical protein
VHGKFYEPCAAARFEETTGKVLMPFDLFKLSQPDAEFEASYSPDGMTTDGEMVSAPAGARRRGLTPEG